MSEELSLAESQRAWHGSLRSYLIGFILSLLLTGLSFFFVYQKILPPSALFFLIMGLAVLQALVQLFFFLHVGAESKPHWQTITFIFMALVLLIVVVGTIWIMTDLNDRMMDMHMEEMSHD